ARRPCARIVPDEIAQLVHSSPPTPRDNPPAEARAGGGETYHPEQYVCIRAESCGGPGACGAEEEGEGGGREEGERGERRSGKDRDGRIEEERLEEGSREGSC